MKKFKIVQSGCEAWVVTETFNLQEDYEPSIPQVIGVLFNRERAIQLLKRRVEHYANKLESEGVLSRLMEDLGMTYVPSSAMRVDMFLAAITAVDDPKGWPIGTTHYTSDWFVNDSAGTEWSVVPGQIVL